MNKIINVEEFENNNRNSYYTRKLDLINDVAINKYEKTEKKVLSNNSFAKKTVYDLSECYDLYMWKKSLLIELNNLYPDYEVYIKTKSCNFQTKIKTSKGFETTSEDLFNTVHFTIDKDKKGSIIWVTPTVSFNKDLSDKLKAKKLESNEENDDSVNE